MTRWSFKRSEPGEKHAHKTRQQIVKIARIPASRFYKPFYKQSACSCRDLNTG